MLAIDLQTSNDGAMQLADGTAYRLGGAVFGDNFERVDAAARRVCSGNEHVNGLNGNRLAPFGGYKQSGIGREFERWGLHEFPEVTSLPPPPGCRLPCTHSTQDTTQSLEGAR